MLQLLLLLLLPAAPRPVCMLALVDVLSTFLQFQRSTGPLQPPSVHTVWSADTTAAMVLRPSKIVLLLGWRIDPAMAREALPCLLLCGQLALRTRVI
jgi:hypothetical protein